MTTMHDNELNDNGNDNWHQQEQLPPPQMTRHDTQISFFFVFVCYLHTATATTTWTTQQQCWQHNHNHAKTTSVDNMATRTKHSCQHDKFTTCQNQFLWSSILIYAIHAPRTIPQWCKVSIQVCMVNFCQNWFLQWTLMKVEEVEVCMLA